MNRARFGDLYITPDISYVSPRILWGTGVLF